MDEKEDLNTCTKKRQERSLFCSWKAQITLLEEKITISKNNTPKNTHNLDKKYLYKY